MRYAYKILDKTGMEMTYVLWDDNIKIDFIEDARMWADVICHGMEFSGGFSSVLWPNGFF
jgi:hypothetical protein